MNSGASKGKYEGKNHYQGYRWKSGEFWKPGDPLTESDNKMLALVRKFYEKNGYPPTKKDVANFAALRGRFRTWKNVLLAAGVPAAGDPDCMRKKQAALEWEKRVSNLK